MVTGATYGKLLLSRTFWGKLAAEFARPEKGAVRCALNADFMDEMGKHEFFAYRKRGVEPSEIPDETVFKVDDMPGYAFAPVKGSFNKTKCSSCGEYVFDRYVRAKDGAPVCIPCSGYEPAPRSRAKRAHQSLVDGRAPIPDAPSLFDRRAE